MLAAITLADAKFGDGKIKRVVVLMEENRSFDHVFGFYRQGKVNGLTGNESNLVDPSDPTSKRVYVSKNATQVSLCDPDHTTPGTTDKIFTKTEVAKGNLTVASMGGFVQGQAAQESSNYCQVMDMQTPETVPIITALADEFVIMDRFFASVPGPTWPNRMFAVSATSQGLTETGPWYKNKKGALFTQKSFFDQVTENGGTWKNYYNDTPWELFMSTIAHNPKNTASMEEFWKDAKEGTLPTYSWINPRSGINMTTGVGSSDQHPDHDMAAGEAYYKDVYEALRSSPQWEETLFIITYDEHGGYYDHVPTPLSAPHPGDGQESFPDAFNFDRLGVRLPTVLISPWLPKGGIESGPPDTQKPAKDSEYDLTSIMATTRKLLGMDTTPLTKRDAWAATFEHLFDTLDTPRTDCPLHLPAAVPPQKDGLAIEAELTPNSLQTHIMTVHAHMADVDYPNTVTAQKHVSEWLLTHYQKHRDVREAAYNVVVSPQAGVTSAWYINEAQGTTMNTLSVQIDKVDFCLDGGSMTLGQNLTVTPCTTDPAHNNVASQQFIHRKDATLRVFANQSLCVDQPAVNTSSIVSGTRRATLGLCSGSVLQSFAYHGAAPGNPFSGSLFYGDGASSLLVVNA